MATDETPVARIPSEGENASGRSLRPSLAYPKERAADFDLQRNE